MVQRAYLRETPHEELQRSSVVWPLREGLSEPNALSIVGMMLEELFERCFRYELAFEEPSMTVNLKLKKK